MSDQQQLGICKPTVTNVKRWVRAASQSNDSTCSHVDPGIWSIQYLHFLLIFFMHLFLCFYSLLVLVLRLLHTPIVQRSTDMTSAGIEIV